MIGELLLERVLDIITVRFEDVIGAVSLLVVTGGAWTGPRGKERDPSSTERVGCRDDALYIKAPELIISVNRAHIRPSTTRLPPGPAAGPSTRHSPPIPGGPSRC